MSSSCMLVCTLFHYTINLSGRCISPRFCSKAPFKRNTNFSYIQHFFTCNAVQCLMLENKIIRLIYKDFFLCFSILNKKINTDLHKKKFHLFEIEFEPKNKTEIPKSHISLYDVIPLIVCVRNALISGASQENNKSAYDLFSMFAFRKI